MSKKYYEHPTIPGLQAVHVIQAFSYNTGTAMAYLWRAGRKPGIDPLEDLQKAIDHINFEMDRIKGTEQPIAGKVESMGYMAAFLALPGWLQVAILLSLVYFGILLFMPYMQGKKGKNKK